MSGPGVPLWELIVLAIWLAGPFPLARWWLHRRAQGQASPLGTTLFLGEAWCILQMALGLALGALGLFRLLPLILAHGVLLAAGLALWQRGRPATASSMGRKRPFSWPFLLLGALAVGSGFQLFLWSVRQPIYDYDSLAYHLPTIANWIQHGRLVLLDQFAHEQIGRYPYNWELLSALLLLCLGDDLLVALPNLLAWMLLGVAIYACAREVDARPSHSLTAALVVLSMPLLLASVNRIQVDLPLAAFFTVGLYWLLTRNEGDRRLAGSGLLMAIGLMAGIKMSGLAYGGLLALPWAVAHLSRLPGISLRPWLRQDLLAGVLSVGTGAFWYVRNYLDLGNPLAYLAVSVGNMEILPGNPRFTARTARTTLAHLFDLGNASHWQIWLEQLRQQMGLPFMLLGGLVLAYGMWRLAKLGTKLLTALGQPGSRPHRPALFWQGSTVTSAGDEQSGPAWRTMAVAALVLGASLLYWYTPYSADNGQNGWQITPWLGDAMRYGFVAAALVAVLAAAVASRLSLPDWVGLVVAAWALTQTMLRLAWYSLPLWTGLALLLILGYHRPGWLLPREDSGPTGGIAGWARSVVVWMVGGMLLAGLGPGLSFLAAQRAQHRAALYGPAYVYLSQAHLDGSVAYLWSHRAYLFYGDRFQQKVVYVPATDGESREDWIQRLEALGVQVVAVGPLRPAWQDRPELAWLAQSPEVFRPLVGADPAQEVVLWQLANSSMSRSP